MVVEHDETSNRVKKLINKLDKEAHIDEMTKRWLSLTLNPPRIPQIYTLTNTPNQPQLRDRSYRGTKAPRKESHHLLIVSSNQLLNHKSRILKTRQTSLIS